MGNNFATDHFNRTQLTGEGVSVGENSAEKMNAVKYKSEQTFY